MTKIVLASKSPRRQELLKLITPDFTVKVPDYDEAPVMSAGLSPLETVRQLSRGKALAAVAQFGGEKETIYIAGDTVVVSPHDEILGKPHSLEEARRMLLSLSGATHQVVTGVTLAGRGKEKTFTAVTEVDFYPLTSVQIEGYIHTDEPYDKAGGYGIQARGGLFVRGIRGDYFNVVGLPAAALWRELESF